jgi:transposase-like protein
MDPQEAFCLNLDCPARGQKGKGNIRVHSRKEQRYCCTLCHSTFSVRKGTVFYRCRVAVETIILVLTLLAHGCPIGAIEAAFGFQRRTVKGWMEAAGMHCEQVHHQQVLKPRDLGQVQADELRVKAQGKRVLWLASAIMVPTRLWLGGVIAHSRDQGLIDHLAELVRACAIPAPLLMAVDGLAAYVKAFRKALRSPEHKGKVGRPRMVAWSGVVLGQVVKQYQKRRVVGVVRRLGQGTEEELSRLIATTQGKGVLNTAYIERLNASFRALLAPLTRRTRNLVRRQQLLHAGMYMVGTVYNFCSYHTSLTGAGGGQLTPAMAAGITDHRWSVGELLWYRIAPTPWRPPKKRGRRSRAVQYLIERWAS